MCGKTATVLLPLTSASRVQQSPVRDVLVAGDFNDVMCTVEDQLRPKIMELNKVLSSGILSTFLQQVLDDKGYDRGDDHRSHRIQAIMAGNFGSRCSLNYNGYYWREESLPGFLELILYSGNQPVDGKIYVMFHGTTYTAAVQIIQTGFEQSEDGMLGRGVYVSRDKNKALV